MHGNIGRAVQTHPALSAVEINESKSAIHLIEMYSIGIYIVLRLLTL